MEVIGYRVSGSDNNCFYLENENVQDAPVCKKCGFLLDPVEYYNPFFFLKKKKFDFSYTYDLRPIVSLSFKEFCIRNKYKNLVFKDFERDVTIFQFIVKNYLEVDTERSNINFESYCEECKQWKGTFIKVLYLKNNTLLPDAFYRTNLLFSQGNRKNPIFLIGIETYRKLKRENLKGLIFDPLYA